MKCDVIADVEKKKKTKRADRISALSFSILSPQPRCRPGHNRFLNEISAERIHAMTNGHTQITGIIKMPLVSFQFPKRENRARAQRENITHLSRGRRTRAAGERRENKYSSMLKLALNAFLSMQSIVLVLSMRKRSLRNWQ